MKRIITLITILLICFNGNSAEDGTYIITSSQMINEPSIGKYKYTSSLLSFLMQIKG